MIGYYYLMGPEDLEPLEDLWVLVVQDLLLHLLVQLVLENL